MIKSSLILISSIMAGFLISVAYADNKPIPTDSCMQTPPTYNDKCSLKMRTDFFNQYYSNAFPASSFSASNYTSNQNTNQTPRLNNLNASNPIFIIKPLQSKSDKKKINTTIKWF